MPIAFSVVASHVETATRRILLVKRCIDVDIRLPIVQEHG